VEEVATVVTLILKGVSIVTARDALLGQKLGVVQVDIYEPTVERVAIHVGTVQVIKEMAKGYSDISRTD